MKSKFYTFFLLAFITLLASCKSATKLYDKGNYDEAVEVAAKKLQKDPNDPKLLNVLQNAYRYAVEDHESRIRNHAATNNELKWEWTYAEYAGLQRLYESIRKSPGVFNTIKPVDYSTYLVTYREKAGESRYDRGMAFMNNNDKQSYRDAYREFEIALSFIPGDIDIRQKMDEAFNNAVVNVIVMPLEERSSYQFSSYNRRYRSFDDQTIRYLQSNNGNRFIKYYSPLDARSRNVRADHIVDVRFSTINVGRSYEDQTNRTVSKDVVVKERVYRPDSIVKEYAKVYAKITTTKRTMRSEGLIAVIIRDENNRRIWNDEYTGQHFWSTEFSTYTGDARALSESDKQFLNQQQTYPPREEDIIRCIMDELQNKVECGIKDFYQRYQY